MGGHTKSSDTCSWSFASCVLAASSVMADMATLQAAARGCYNVNKLKIEQAVSSDLSSYPLLIAVVYGNNLDYVQVIFEHIFVSLLNKYLHTV